MAKQKERKIAVKEAKEAGLISDLTSQQQLFLDLYFDTKSPTFGNAYQSAIASGYSDNYARQILNIGNNWITENNRLRNLDTEHILQGIQDLALSASRSKSPDDTRLKAYELLARVKGMLIERKQIQHQMLKLDLTGVLDVPDNSLAKPKTENDNTPTPTPPSNAPSPE